MKHAWQRLKTIVDNAAGNRYFVPDLQRDFKWGQERIRSLLASVISGQPIGSLLLVSEITDSEVAVTLNRSGRVDGRSPYVLDGQQRLVSLLAGFRSPRRGKESEWFERRAGLIWRLDVGAWVEALRKDPSLMAGDPRLVERCIRFRRRSRGRQQVTAANGRPLTLAIDSRECMARAREGDSFELPLWYLLRSDSRSAPDAAADFDDFIECLRVHHDDAPEEVDLVVQLLRQVPEYRVPIVVLDPCSSATAAEVFRRINRQGEPLALTDLVCSQFFVHDPALRTNMRELQSMCDRFDCPSLYGIHEEDILRIALLSSAPGTATAASAFDRLLARAQTPEGVKLVRAGVDRMDAALEYAAEILAECGVEDRESWPIDSVVHALVAAIAVHQEQLVGRRSGVWKHRLKKWWWGEVMRQLPLPRRPGPIDVVRRLTKEIEAGESGQFRMPTSLQDAGLRDRMRSEQPFPSLRLTVECLLRSQQLRDFATFRDMPASGESLDLHHLFPKAWARRLGIPGVDCLANLTLMSATTNRAIIRDKGPKEFVDELLHGAEDARHLLYKIMREHGIEPEPYLAGDFESFMERRLQWFDRCLASIAQLER